MGAEIRQADQQADQSYGKMKQPAEPGKCCRCHHQDATKANECRVCHSVTLCMVTIHAIYAEDELRDLADNLSKTAIREFIELSKKQGAYYRTKVGNTISRLAHPAKITPDDLKRKVVTAIAEYLGEMDGIRAYEAKPGNAGKYMQHWKASISECLAAIAKKASNIQNQ